MRARQVSSISAGNSQQLLFVGRALNFQLTSDQALTKVFSGTNYVVTAIVGVRVSGGATVACAGGVYTAASKAGTAVVAAAQSWITLTGTLGYIGATLAALGAALSATPLYLSLTTGSTAAVTGDVFIYGIIVD
jgi:hypothetical protein